RQGPWGQRHSRGDENAFQWDKGLRRRTELVPALQGSKRVAENLLKPISIATTEGELRPILKDHGVVTVESGLQFADALNVDDGRTMDAEEAVAIESGFQTVHGFPQEVCFRSHVQASVVAGRFDPIDLLQAHEINPAGRFDNEALKRLFS